MKEITVDSLKDYNNIQFVDLRDTKDFENHIEKRIVLNNELNDKKEELQAMQNEHENSQYLVDNDTSYNLQGGK